MNKNTSSSLSLSGSSSSSSSSDGPIRVPALIVPLREALEKEGSLISKTMSVLSKRDVDLLYDAYHISRESFRVLAPSLCVCVNDLIHTKDTIIVFEEQLKVGL